MENDEAADDRPENVGEAPYAGEHALHHRALLQRVEVGGDGHGGRLDGAGTQALQDAEGDQPGKGMRGSAQRRAGQEEEDAAEERGLAAELLSALAGAHE